MVKLSRLIEMLQEYLDKHGDGELPMFELGVLILTMLNED